MTIWVLHQKMTADEESNILESEYLALPFEGLPDLTGITSQARARKLLVTLYPDEPPESINRRLDRFWNTFIGFHKEDIVAVPLTNSQEVVIAEITGGYQYHVGEGGTDVHRVPVKFYQKRIAMGKFKKHKELFEQHGQRMFEVTDPGARIALRDHLPHAYNRFAKYKWLLIVFFLMSMVRMFQRFATP